MSSKINESLHDLIKSLSKSEKRYFKIISSRHTIGEENNYMILFDFLDQQEFYNEETVFEKFAGQPFLNKFSLTKKRLYDHILTALNAFHTNTSIDAQIYQLIQGADILYNKALYIQCKRQLKSAEKLAVKHEKFNLLAEINFKIKRLLESTENLDKKTLDNILNKDIVTHNKSLIYDKLWNIKSKLFSILSSKGIPRTESELLNFKEIINDLSSINIESELYFNAQYLYNHIYSAYYFATF
jgi:hypothetical protein